MRPVERAEIVDWQTWTDLREAQRPRVLEAKRVRRVPIGSFLTLLFENRDTVRYQVQEMMRVERIVRERDIQHELGTYNELLGGDGELGTTLLIGIEDADARDGLLRRWIGLQERVYVVLPGGERVRPTWDPRQVGTDRISSVQYLRFATGGVAPIAVGCDFDDPQVCLEVSLNPEQIAALAEDLAG